MFVKKSYAIETRDRTDGDQDITPLGLPAEEDWILANLRKESGGQITDEEMANYKKTYFPQAGEGQNIVLQKKAARIKAQEAMLRNAGGAFTEKVNLPKVYHTKEPPENANPGDLWQDSNGARNKPSSFRIAYRVTIKGRSSPLLPFMLKKKEK